MMPRKMAAITAAMMLANMTPETTVSYGCKPVKKPAKNRDKAKAARKQRSKL